MRHPGLLVIIDNFRLQPRRKQENLKHKRGKVVKQVFFFQLLCLEVAPGFAGCSRDVKKNFNFIFGAFQ